MTSITLTRKQIEQISEIAKRFSDTNSFNIKVEGTSDNTGGIGPVVAVCIDLFEKHDTRIDITDIGVW